MNRPMIHHRAPAFKKEVEEAVEGLRYLFQTSGDVFFLTTSGTGAMEAAVVNTMCRGDRALVIRGGKFGERWGKICEAYGLDPLYYDVNWGEAANPEVVGQLLEENPDLRCVFMQYSETSTAVAHPVEAISKLTRSLDETLLVVDGITAVGVTELPFDDWGIDVLVAGSQMALMLPPGLAMGAVSDKAKKAFSRSDLPKFYLDLSKEVAAQAKGQTAYTPAVSLVIGMVESLRMLKEEGLEACFARHRKLGTATREGLKALGLELFAPSSPSPAVTAVKVPEGVDGQAVVKEMRARHGITIAGGQDHLKGKILRLSHMGYVDALDILSGLAATGDVLLNLGAEVDPGACLSAAQAIFAEN